jgi:hypothetical protein
MRKVFAVPAFVSALCLLFAGPPALAANGDCAQPVSAGGTPTATDCLRILNVAVGLASCAPHADCVCAPKGTLPATATDSLRCLSAAVGGSAALECPCGSETTTTTTNGQCSIDAHCDDGEPCNGFETCNGGACVGGDAIACDDDDLVVVVPYQQPADVVRGLVEADTTITKVDAYLLLDRAASMSGEITALKSSIGDAVRAAACFPIGTGTPPDCVEDLYTGVGWVGYGGTAGEAFRNRRDLQPDPGMLEARFPTTEPAGCCARTTKLALWSTASGLGNINVGCTVGSTYAGNSSCSDAPAGDDGIGFPCFRLGALRGIFLFTDEQPSTGHTCPTVSRATDEAVAAGLRIVSLYGDGASAATISELESMATSTNAVDANAANAPLVFDAGVANVSSALTSAILALAQGARLSEVTATAVDDPSDAVDATLFVDTFRTTPLGGSGCTGGLVERDTDFDGLADAYLAAPSGVPLCWTVVPTTNTTVAPTTIAQIFRVTVTVNDTGFEALDVVQMLFVVPPA